MKNILVIGGSTGIGLQLVKNMSANNRVFATYNQHPTDNFNNATFHPLNVLDSQFDLSFLPETIDGIAYCVGAINLKPFARISEDDFINDYKKQVGGAIRIIQALLPKLKMAEQASIVLFSTIAVQTGFSFHTLVASSKGAIEGLTKALAAEFAPKIRVNCIAPSITDTPLAAALLNTEEKKMANAQRHPLKQVGEANDLANMAEFLLTEKSKWITGQIFHVDGGMSTLKV
jgi:NAD(P)-dependent dehydrogenase (short-subunit alcohol dehydrogenase family)